MGSKSQDSTQNQSQSGTSSVTLAPRSGSEQQILNQLQGLGDNQLSFLTGLLGGGVSPYKLSPADQQTLNDSYNSAFQQFNQSGKDYADYLATTRGLNKSDTPVSQQAMQRYGLGMSDLLSQKANAALNMGLQGTQLRLGATSALPSGLVGAFNPQFQERLATPTQSYSGTMSGSSHTQYNPSLMDNIGQGMALGSQAIGLGAQLGGLAMGVPMPSLGAGGGYANSGLDGLAQYSKPTGMGSGASANMWFA